MLDPLEHGEKCKTFLSQLFQAHIEDQTQHGFIGREEATLYQLYCPQEPK